MAGRREFVAFARSRKLSARQACGLVRVSRRRLGYVSQRRDDDLIAQLKELAAAYPRYGYRRLHVMLNRQLKKCGDRRKLNVKRVRRLCRKLGLRS